MNYLILAALLAGDVIVPAATAQGAPAVEKSAIKDEKVVEGADSDEAKLVNACSARKFETSAELDKDGNKRVTKLKLCSVAGADDMAWIKTLEGAKARVAGIPDLSAESRVKIEAELDAEIAKVKAAGAVANAPPSVTAPLAPSPAERATLAPVPAAPAIAANSLLASPESASRMPRLTIRCAKRSEPGGGGPCISLERDTLMTVRADEDLVGETRLRFLRRGSVRSEVALAQMRQGQSLRFELPKQLCAGVASSKVEIQILGRGVSGTGANQVKETLGPYQLRC